MTYYLMIFQFTATQQLGRLQPTVSVKANVSTIKTISPQINSNSSSTNISRVNQEYLNLLVGMGYPDLKAIQALRATGNHSLNEAIKWLNTSQN